MQKTNLLLRNWKKFLDCWLNGRVSLRYSRNLSIKPALVIRLHQLCANLNDLDDFLMTNNDKNLWFEEEDQLLM